GGGRIQGTSTCRRAGMQVSVTMDGSFTPTSYDVHQQMHSTMSGRTSESTNHLVGRRVGECTPADAQAAAARDGAAGGKSPRHLRPALACGMGRRHEGVGK